MCGDCWNEFSDLTRQLTDADDPLGECGKECFTGLIVRKPDLISVKILRS